MHVAQIGFTYDDDLSDAEALLARCHTLVGWAEALAEAGVQSSVVHRFRRNVDLQRNGVEYRFRAIGLHRAIDELAPDIVHVNGLGFPMQTWRCRRRLSPATTLIVQDHASGEPRVGASPARRLHDAIRRRAMRSVDAFFFVADVQADPWRRHGLIEFVQPVYEVMEASTWFRPMARQPARAMTGIDGEPALLWVGRLNANKDPITVLDGFDRVLREFPSASLTMLSGAGDLEREVRERIAASPRLAPNVTLAGSVPRDRLPAFYSAADLFVLGSHHEGSGYALIEACACGAVPVVTDIPAFRVITRSGAIGALWPTGDSGAFATALREAILASGSDQVRERVKRHFDEVLSWRAVADRAVRSYRDAAARRGQQRTA
jgi:glycosyltransferase involved in cell wall biosynthesis